MESWIACQECRRDPLAGFIMGKVLPLGGIQQKVRAAYDAGVREVLLPADNLKEAQGLPAYVLDSIKLTPVNTIDKVIEMSLMNNTAGGA